MPAVGRSYQEGAKPFYTKLSRASDMLGISIITMREWAKRNRIPAVKLGKYWYVPTSWLEKVLTEGFTFEDKKEGGTP